MIRKFYDADASDKAAETAAKFTMGEAFDAASLGIDSNENQFEEKIEAFENEITKMEIYLASPEGASDMDYLQKYLDIKTKLDKVMNKWERSTLELEKLQEIK